MAGLRRTVPTVFMASLQLITVGHYFIGYIPGGMTGLKWLLKLWYKTMESIVLPCLTRVTGFCFRRCC